jgi:hypothetical protein
MNKRYTLTDCYELLQVDPKTFRRWIEKASITPQASKADDRIKYLTHEQLVELAELHERSLPETLPQQEAALAPGAYKLLLDQIEEVHQAQIGQAVLLQSVQENNVQLIEQVTTLYGEQGLLNTGFNTFKALTEHKLAEVTRAVEDQARIVEGLRVELETLTRDQARDVALLTEQMEGIPAQIERIGTLSQEAQRGAAQKIEQLAEALRQEREARESLAAQVGTLLQKKQPVPPRKRGAVQPGTVGQEKS